MGIILLGDAALLNRLTVKQKIRVGIGDYEPLLEVGRKNTS